MAEMSDVEPERLDNSTNNAELMKRLYRHYDRLLLIVKRNLPVWMDRYVDPEDVLQGAFVRAFASIDRFTQRDDQSDFRWLCTITKHYVINLVEFHRAARRHGVGHDISLPNTSDTNAVAILHAIGKGQKTPSQIAADREGISRINHALNALHPAELQAVTLRYVEGHDVQSTANTMGRTPRAIQQLCYRAMKRLCSILRGSSYYSSGTEENPA